MKAEVELELSQLKSVNELEVLKTFRYKTNCEIPVETIYNIATVTPITVSVDKFLSTELVDFLFACRSSKDELSVVRDSDIITNKSVSCRLIINGATINDCVIVDVKHRHVGVDLVLWLVFKGGKNG